MKIQTILKTAVTAFGLAVLFMPTALFAEEAAKSRDFAVDQVLGGGGNLAGVLPATAGEGMIGGAIAHPQTFIDPARPDRFPDPALMVSDRADKKGRVYEIKGKVKISKKGSAEWKSLSNNNWIEEGDAVLTEKSAYVSVTFDARYLNVTHIPENTRAVFKSIEPLDLFVEDGTVFNIFDGLSPKSDWKVSTPTAVATVRGTYFAVHFTAGNGDLFTATFKVPDDGHESFVELMDVLSGGGTGNAVNIPEGNQIYLKEGQTPDPSMFGGISQEWLDQIQEILKRLMKFRQNQGGNVLPPTSGEFFDPNVLDPAGSNQVGGGPDVPDLDPLNETGSAGSPEQEIESGSSGESYPEEECPNCNQEEPSCGENCR